MVSPITLVKLLIKEADSNESCVKCGTSGSGLSSFVIYIYYTDPDTEELMFTGWSFPICQKHIPEEMEKHQADQEMIIEDRTSELEVQTGGDLKPPPFTPYFVPHAN